MSTETSTATGTETVGRNAWIAGALGGVLGSVVFGAMIQLSMPPTIAGAIPALWGLSGIGAGWVVHLVNGAILGLAYAAIVENSDLRGYAAELRSGWALGGAWGVVLWLVAAGVVMPIWLAAVGFPAAPQLPNLNPQTLPGHVVYGVVLGLAYPVLRSR